MVTSLFLRGFISISGWLGGTVFVTPADLTWSARPELA